MTQEEAQELAEHAYDVPKEGDLKRDGHDPPRWEKVFYRYNLYNQGGIYLGLTIYRIEEAWRSKRIPRFTGTLNATDGNRQPVEDSVTAVYDENEPNVYGARFYLEYANDHLKEHFRQHYSQGNYPVWPTLEEAEQELASLDFEAVPFVGDEGRTFYIIDKGHSHLFDPWQDGTIKTLPSLRPGSITIFSTSLIAAPKGGAAYAISVTGTEAALDGRIGEKPKVGNFNIEGVQPNSGKSRLLYLMRRWDKLGPDGKASLPLAEATKSQGYANIVAPKS